MKYLLFIAATAVALLLPVSVQAAPPAHPYHLTTVKWIIAHQDDLKVDDRYVTLIGHCTRRSGEEGYHFTDGTGTIRLDSENFKLPIGRKIVVGGRIDEAYLGIGPLEVDVRAWHSDKSATAKTTSSKTSTTAKPEPAKTAPATKPTPSATTAPAATPVPETTPAPAPSTPPAPETTSAPALAPPSEPATNSSAK